MRTTVLLSGVAALVSAAPAATVDKAVSGSGATIVEARGEPKDGNWHIGCNKADKHHRESCFYYQGVGPVQARGEPTSAYADYTSSKPHSDYKSPSYRSSEHKTTSEYSFTTSKYTPSYPKPTHYWYDSPPIYAEPESSSSSYLGHGYGSSSTYHRHKSSSSTYSGHKSSSSTYSGHKSYSAPSAEYGSSSSTYSKHKSYGYDDYKPTHDRRGNYTEPKHTQYQPPAYTSTYPVYSPPFSSSIYTPPPPHTPVYSPPAYTSVYTPPVPHTSIYSPPTPKSTYVPPVSVYSQPYSSPVYKSSYTPPTTHSSVYTPIYTPPTSSYHPPPSSVYTPPSVHSSHYSPPKSHSSKYTSPVHKSSYSSPTPSAYTKPGYTSSYAKHHSGTSSYSGHTTKSYAATHSAYTAPAKPSTAPVCNFAESECIDCNEHPEACSTCNFMFMCGEKKQCTYFGIGEIMTMCKETAEECDRPCDDYSDDGLDLLDLTDDEITECLEDLEQCKLNAPDDVQDFVERVIEIGEHLCEVSEHEHPFCRYFNSEEEDGKPEHKPHADKPVPEAEKPDHHSGKPEHTEDHEEKPKHPEDHEDKPSHVSKPEEEHDDEGYKSPQGPDGKKKAANDKSN